MEAPDFNIQPLETTTIVSGKEKLVTIENKK
jgi:hypothetical protein